MLNQKIDMSKIPREELESLAESVYFKFLAPYHESKAWEYKRSKEKSLAGNMGNKKKKGGGGKRC